MKKSLILLSLFICSLALAQNTKYVPMERHVFNVSAQLQGGGYVYATVALTFGRYEIDENDAPRPTFNYLEAMVEKVLADHDSSISSEDGQQALKQEIQDALNARLTKGGVVDVTFINFKVW